MQDYYYMFSKGEYSDYCVGGLYKSKQKLSEEYFVNYVRQMIVDQVKDWPEAVEYINNLKPELCILLGWSLPRNLFALAAGPCPDYRNKDGQNAWDAAYKNWQKSVGEIDRDFVQSLVKSGILEKIEYEEIWEG